MLWGELHDVLQAGAEVACGQIGSENTNQEGIGEPL